MAVDRQTGVEPLLVNGAKAAALLGISRSKFYQLHSSGRLPLPVCFDKSVRWSVEELRQFITARNPKTGLLPTRQQWIEFLENRKC